VAPLLVRGLWTRPLFWENRFLVHRRWSFGGLQPGPGLGQFLLQPALNGEDPLGDLQPAGAKLMAKIAGVFQEFGDFFFAGTG